MGTGRALTKKQATILLAIKKEMSSGKPLEAAMREVILMIRLFLNKESPNRLAITIVEIGADDEKKPQADEGHNAIYLLQCPDVVDENLGDGNSK